MHMMSCSSS